MGELPLVQLFCEDAGHETVVRSLVQRLSREEAVSVRLRTASARGGHGRVVAELKLFQRYLLRGGHGIERPQLLLVVVDGNCTGWQARCRELRQVIDHAAFPLVVVAAPDPHVERWLQADPDAFARVVGGPPKPDPGKCERSLYKRLVREAIVDAGNVLVGDVAEFAPDIVVAMDLYRAGKRQPSFGHLVDELRRSLHAIRA